MRCWPNARIVVYLLASFLVMALASPCRVAGQAKPAALPGDVAIAKAVGTIKSVQTDSITIAAESGGEVTAKVTGSTKILRVSPEEKTLKNATAMPLQDLQPGDRVLVRGKSSADQHTMAALTVIVMKQADLSVQHEREREDWQKRGVDGLVDRVDAATGTITISAGGLGAKRSIVVHASKDTVLRRYAPDSVKFDDAKPAPLDQIKVGDQLRARGPRTPDGSGLTAEEIVWGTFRNIAGTIAAIDVANNTVTVRDLIAKAPVTVRITSDSQIKKLPPEMAQRFAARLKGGNGANEGHQWSPQGRNAQSGSQENAPAVAKDSPQAGAEGSSQSPHRPGAGQGATVRQTCSAF